MLKLITGEVPQITTQCLVIPVCQDRDIHADIAVTGIIQKIAPIREFQGKKDESLLLYHADGVTAERLLFMGMGKSTALDVEGFRAMAGKSVSKAIAQELSEMTICVPDAATIGLDPEVLASGLMEGACLGNHIFDAYKQEKKKKPLKTVALLAGAGSWETFKKLPARVEAICRGTVLAREWVSMPGNDKTPDRLARSMVKAAEKEDLSFTILDDKFLRQSGMGAIMAVGAGSRSKPRLLILDYNPYKTKKSAKNKRTVALVGKGVTFDSGGINLKPAASLDEMKMDMAGAAAVAATLITLARLNHRFRVVGVIPVVENMPSGDATRPGDIVKTYSGKTVEIGNTDAEGRLILADAMSYAIKMFKPDLMIDLATLTGACMIALGEKIAGVFSKDQKLRADIAASGEATAERCWPMPMPEDYKTLLKSDFADINNMSSTRYGGAITAALFLSEFAGDTPWAHIDIAGPAYSKKGGDYCGPGGTGFGVRLMVDFLEKIGIGEISKLKV